MDPRIALALKHVDLVIRKMDHDGKLRTSEAQPMLLGYANEELAFIAPVEMSDEIKEVLPNLFKELLRQRGCDAYAFVVEAWQSTHAPSEKIESLPRDNPNREEVLLVNIGSVTADLSVYYPIRHEANGRVIGPRIIPDGNATNRFLGLLSGHQAETPDINQINKENGY